MAKKEDVVYRVSVVDRRSGRAATGFPRLCTRRGHVTQIRNARPERFWDVNVEVTSTAWVSLEEYDAAVAAEESTPTPATPRRAPDGAGADPGATATLLGDALGQI